MSLSRSPQRQFLLLRPLSMLIYTLIVMSLTFAAALSIIDTSVPLTRLMIFLLPIGIIISSLFTYLNCIASQNGGILLALLVLISAGFMFSAALWFVEPGQERLEPLTTLLALNAAFLGFLTSTSGRGRLMVDFRMNDSGTLNVMIKLNLKDPGRSGKTPEP